MPDAFKDIASKYHARVQYSPVFFERVAQELKWRPDSRLLDAGCGGGELAKGISPYVAEVVALDKSEEMLKAARENAPSNTCFKKGEVGACDVGRFDAVLVGRALRYMPRKPTIDYFESVLPKAGAVVTCAAVITKANAWRKAYNDVRRQYGYRADAFSFKDTEYFSDTPFDFVKIVRIKSRAEFTLDALIANALAYRSSFERISSNIHQFRADLESALKPYEVADGLFEGVVASAGLIFKKA